MPDALPRFEDHRAHAEAIIRAVLEAADPARALLRRWPAKLDDGRPTVVIAIGKASLEMAKAAIDRLGPALVRAVITAVPERINAYRFDARVSVFPADHPAPTPRNMEAARAVAELARSVTPDQRAILLISGGGSAHLTLPADGVTLDDLAAVSQALQSAGAPIQDLNTIRKHTEQLKGGRLARLMHAAEIYTFILSDVMHDPLDVIASGPAAPDPTTCNDAALVLARYRVLDDASSVSAHVRRGLAGVIEETPKPGDPAFARITNTVIANNATAVEAGAAAAERLGFTIRSRQTGVEGESSATGRAMARELRALAEQPSSPSAIIIGGETTVRITGSSPSCPPRYRGHGGPSQELALAAAIDLDAAPHTALLAFSTDGIDGPNDAAGAIITGQTVRAALGLGLNPQDSLLSHDSHTILDRLGALIRTGPTGTNINHIAVGLVYPRD